jgi:hypothetical protein
MCEREFYPRSGGLIVYVIRLAWPNAETPDTHSTYAFYPCDGVGLRSCHIFKLHRLPIPVTPVHEVPFIVDARFLRVHSLF